MKVFFGAMLMACTFLLVPSIHKFVAKFFGVKRQKLAYFGLLAAILLIFAILPLRGQYVLGLIFIVIAGIMQWVVPRHSPTRRYVSDVLFGGADIADEDAPYSRVVGLFKLPLLGLGLWVIAPATMILLDIAAVAGAFWYWQKAVKKADLEESKKHSSETMSVSDDTTKTIVS